MPYRTHTVRFQPNVPVQVALLWPTGKIVPTFFGQRVFYSLEGKQVMFLPHSAAMQITRLGVKPGQHFLLCRFKEKRGAIDRWRAWLPGQPVPVPESASLEALAC